MLLHYRGVGKCIATVYNYTYFPLHTEIAKDINSTLKNGNSVLTNSMYLLLSCMYLS